MGPDAKKRKNQKKKLKLKQKKLHTSNGSTDESVNVSQITDVHLKSSAEAIDSVRSVNAQVSPQPEASQADTPQLVHTEAIPDAVPERNDLSDLFQQENNDSIANEAAVFDSIVKEQAPDVPVVAAEFANDVNVGNVGTLNNAQHVSNEIAAFEKAPDSVIGSMPVEAQPSVINDPVEELFGNDDTVQTEELPWQDQIIAGELPGTSAEVGQEQQQQESINDYNEQEQFPSLLHDEKNTVQLDQSEREVATIENFNEPLSQVNDGRKAPNLVTLDALLDDDNDYLTSDNDTQGMEHEATQTEVVSGENSTPVQPDNDAIEKANGDEDTDLFNSEGDDGAKEGLSWLNDPSNTQEIPSPSEEATKFSFLENDDDLLDDDESLLDSDEEVIVPQPQTAQAPKKSYLPSASSPVPQSVKHSYHPQSNPYSPQASSFSNSVSGQPPSFPQNPSSYTYPVASTVPASVAPGIVKPKLINNSNSSQSSVSDVNELHKKLDEAKHRTDAYDFPLDLVKQEIKRGKPMHITSPLPSIRQPSFSSVASEKPLIQTPVRPQPNNTKAPQKPFYAELPIPELKPTRAAPIRIASQNSFSGSSALPSQPIAAQSRRTSIDPPINPYAPKKNVTVVNPTIAPNSVPYGINTVSSKGQNLQANILSAPPRNTIVSPVGTTAHNPYTPSLKSTASSSIKKTPYQPAQPRRNRVLTNASADSTGSFKPGHIPPIPGVPSTESNVYSFPPQHLSTAAPTATDHLQTTFDSHNVPPVLSPTLSTTANNKKTHARSNSSIYAPAHHAHSSKYAPTVHPQFQQQHQHQHQQQLQLQQLQQQQQQQQQLNGIPVGFPQSQADSNYGYSSQQNTNQPIASTFPIMDQSRNPLVQANGSYIVSRQFPIFHWGKSAKVVVGIPSTQDYISAVEPKLDSINVISNDSILTLDKTLEQFPGPLIKGKSKSKDIAKWLDTYIEEKKLRGANDTCILLELLKLRLDPAYSLKTVTNIIYDSSILLPYLSQPFIPKVAAPNAHKLDANSLIRVLTLLQTGAHDDALNLSLALKDYAMALLLGSILGKEKWSSVVDQYLTQEFEQSNERDISSINLLATIFQVFIGNSKKVIDSFKQDPTKLEWSLNNWKLLIACILNNCEDVSANGKLSPIVVEFLLQFGELLVSRGLVIAGSIAFIVADIPMSEEPLIPFSSTTFEYICCPNSFESLILSEIYEFTYGQKDPSFSGFTSLIPQKIIHAAGLSDYGLNSSSTKYMDMAQSMLKSLPKNSETTLKTLRYIEDLSNQLSSSNVGWLGKPKLSSVWGQLDKSFNKFIGGDTDIDESETAAIEDKVFEKFTPTSSRNPSMADLSQAASYLTPALNRSHINQLQSNNSSLIKSTTKILPASSLSSRETHSKYGPPPLRDMKPQSKIGELYGSHSNIEPLNSTASARNTVHPSHFEEPDNCLNPSGAISLGQKELPNSNSTPEPVLPPLAQVYPGHQSHHDLSDGNSSVSSGHRLYGKVGVPNQNTASFSVPSPVVSPQSTKDQSSTSNKALPLENLFDDTVTSGLTTESTQTGSNAPPRFHENEQHSVVDDIVEEIGNEIDAELDELQHSEFSDDNNFESTEQNSISDVEGSISQLNVTNQLPVAENLQEEDKNQLTDINVPVTQAQPLNSFSPVSSISSKPSSLKNMSVDKAEPANPYAPKNSFGVAPRTARKSYNPYSPSSITESHSMASLPQTSSSPYNNDINSAPINETGGPEDLAMYAYGSYKLSGEDAKPQTIDSPNGQKQEIENKTSSSPLNSFVPSNIGLGENLISVKAIGLPAHLQNDSQTLPSSKIKDPVIRPVQTSNFVPFIVSDTNTEEYYDDLVEDTEDEDEDEPISVKRETSERNSENQNQKVKNDEVGDEVKAVSEDEDGKPDKKQKNESSGGWLGWFKKDSNEKKPIKAKLGHANNFYYDETLKRWVNKDATEEEKVKVATPPPPPPVVKRKMSKTPEIKPRQGSVVGGPALRTAHAVMPTNPLTGKPLDPVKDFSDDAETKSESPVSSKPPVLNTNVNLSGSKANGLDDLMALTGGVSSASSTRRKKKSTRGYVNVMENL